MKFDVPKEILDYMEITEQKYQECKIKRVSRFSPEWGVWSREMNLTTKKETGVAYKYLFVYWILKSELLELHFKSKYGKQGKKKKLSNEAKDIRKIIELGEGPDLVDDDIKKRLLKGVVHA